MWSLYGKADVYDTQGRLFFKTKLKAFFWRADSKTIFNVQDEPMCSLSRKAFSLHNVTYLCPGASVDKRDALLTARSKFFSWKPILNIFLKGNSFDDRPDIVLKGDFSGLKFTITTSTGLLLAEFKRDIFSAEEFLRYAVRINPNVDTALVIALVGMAESIFFPEDIGGGGGGGGGGG
ncbi:unnamed protein product [Closterium sp. NIES-64]|nr:unnamed protein product [Closterium sp. NIES-64]